MANVVRLRPKAGNARPLADAPSLSPVALPDEDRVALTYLEAAHGDPHQALANLARDAVAQLREADRRLTEIGAILATDYKPGTRRG